MTILLLSAAAAAGLILVLTLFLRSRHSEATPASREPAVRVLPEPSPLTPVSINRAIFSERDWTFIQAQNCPTLEKLFLAERRNIATIWLKETSVRVSEIRRTHLLNSRYSRDLSPRQEFQLLCRFLYLSFGCRFGVLLVHLAGPTAPASLAAHLQHLADTLPVAAKGTLSHAPEN